MSEIKVDTLTGKTSAGDITVTSEGGAATMQLQQGLAKAWATVDQTGTMAFLDSFNCASLSDDGTGQTTISFSSAFANINYSVGSTCEQGSGANDSRVLGRQNTTPRVTNSFPFFVLNVELTALLDVDVANTIFHGDLA